MWNYIWVFVLGGKSSGWQKFGRQWSLQRFREWVIYFAFLWYIHWWALFNDVIGAIALSAFKLRRLCQDLTWPFLLVYSLIYWPSHLATPFGWPLFQSVPIQRRPHQHCVTRSSVHITLYIYPTRFFYFKWTFYDLLNIYLNIHA